MWGKFGACANSVYRLQEGCTSRISRPQDLSANSLTTGVLTNGFTKNSTYFLYSILFHLCFSFQVCAIILCPLYQAFPPPHAEGLGTRLPGHQIEQPVMTSRVIKKFLEPYVHQERICVHSEEVGHDAVLHNHQANF